MSSDLKSTAKLLHSHERQDQASESEKQQESRIESDLGKNDTQVIKHPDLKMHGLFHTRTMQKMEETSVAFQTDDTSIASSQENEDQHELTSCKKNSPEHTEVKLELPLSTCILSESTTGLGSTSENVLEKQTPNEQEEQDLQLTLNSNNKNIHETSQKQQQVQFICCDCGTSIGRRDHMRRHLGRSHGYAGSEITQKLVECIRVIKSEAPEKLYMHAYHCDICGKSFRRKHALVSHRNLHNMQKNVSLKHVCTDCFASFTDHEQLEHHLYDAHEIKDSKVVAEKLALCECEQGSSEDESLPAKDKRSVLDSSYTTNMVISSIRIRPKEVTERPSCSLCNSTFKSKRNLRKHMKRVHQGLRKKPELCDVCGKEYVCLTDHIKSIHYNIKKPVRCDILCDVCGKKFKGKASLHHHMYSHLPAPSCRCEKCGKMLKTPASLRMHKKTVHDRVPRKIVLQKTIPCSECNVLFTCMAKLNKHMRLHTGETPHKCSECNAAFKWEQSLLVHMRRHNNEYPYECNICQKKFRWGRSYKVHMASPIVHRKISSQLIVVNGRAHERKTNA